MMSEGYIATDNELIAAIKEDRGWAVNQLYVKYNDKIRRYLMGRGANSDQSIECYQETIMSVLKLIKTGMLDQNEGVVEPFLKRVAWYQWHKSIRSDKRRQNREKDIIETMGTELEPDALDIMVSEEHGSERMSQLRGAYQTLSSRCKAVLELGFFAQPSHSANEIADILGLANANVARVTKTNCIKSLRKAYFKG
jgi:RNA polymerase sigma factor (sigma-70 family)